MEWSSVLASFESTLVFFIWNTDGWLMGRFNFLTIADKTDILLIINCRFLGTDCHEYKTTEVGRFWQVRSYSTQSDYTALHSQTGTRQISFMCKFSVTDLSHHADLCNAACVPSQSKMAASGKDFAAEYKLKLSSLSCQKSAFTYIFIRNFHSSDRTTAESVVLVRGLFLPVWDDRTSG